MQREWRTGNNPKVVKGITRKLCTDKYSRLEETLGVDLLERLVERILLEVSEYHELLYYDESVIVEEEIEIIYKDWTDKIRL